MSNAPNPAAEVATSKVVDVAIPQASQETPPPAPAEGETPEAAKPAESAAPQEASKLERARAVARARHAEAQRRMLLQEQANRAAQEAQRARYQLELERQKAQGIQGELDRLRDPMAALEHLERVGLPAKTLAQKAIESETPEAKLRAELRAELKAELEASKKAYETELKAFRDREAAQQQAVQAQAIRNQFIQDASNESDFPAVAQVVKLGDEWKASILDEATRVLQEAFRRTGQHYTNREVLSYLNAKYQKLVPNPKDAASKSNGSAPPKEAAGTSPEKSAAGDSRTLTNKAAQVKGSLPPDFDKLSDREQKAALAAMYRASKRE